MKSYQYIFTKLLLDFPESENRIIKANNNFVDFNFEGEPNVEFLKSGVIILAIKLLFEQNKKFVIVSTRTVNNSLSNELIAILLSLFKVSAKKQKNIIKIGNENQIEFRDVINYNLKQEEEIEEIIFYNCTIKNKLKFENDLEIIEKGLSKTKRIRTINIKL